MESIKIHHIKEILNEHYKNKNPDLLLCRTTIGKIYDVLYPMFKITRKKRRDDDSR